MQTLRMRNGERARAKMFRKESAQVPAGYAEAVGEVFYIAFVERAVSDESKTAFNGR